MSTRRGSSVRKALSDWGMRHGVENVYRPMRRPGEPDILVTDERLRVHRNVFWFGAAMLYGVTGGLTLLMLLLNSVVDGVEIPAEAVSATNYAMSVLALLFTVFWLLMAAKDQPALPWMNAIVGVGTVLISIAALQSGSFGPIILPYLLAPAMAAAFYMEFRQAAVHLHFRHRDGQGGVSECSVLHHDGCGHAHGRAQADPGRHRAQRRARRS
jgi:hypothetical protein